MLAQPGAQQLGILMRGHSQKWECANPSDKQASTSLEQRGTLRFESRAYAPMTSMVKGHDPAASEAAENLKNLGHSFNSR